MKVTEFDVNKELTKLINIYSNGFLPKEDDLAAKVLICTELMGNFEDRIFKLACKKWIDEEKKMPSPHELRKKCFEVFQGQQTKTGSLSPHELICRYVDYGDVDECETSRYLCANGSDRWPLDADQINFCMNHRPDKKIICYWHRQVIMSKQGGGGDGWDWVKWIISETRIPMQRLKAANE